jgi:prepilin-type N-terminal cleavage/methylation domain-containing protein
MRRPSVGFTLLEVLAAVAVIAIIFTTLARVASEGLQSEGTSRRRLEASLLADETLAVIEAGFASGEASEIGETTQESEDGVFSIQTAVSNFDVASAIPELVPEETEPSVAANLAAILGVEDPTAAPSLFGVVGDDVSPVREIRVSVTWTEGFHEYEVIRTTYALDLAALESVVGTDSEGLPVPGSPPAS